VAETRVVNLAAQHFELFAQHQDLDILGSVPPAPYDQQLDEPAEDLIYAAHRQSLPTWTPHRRTSSSPPRNRISGTHRISDEACSLARAAGLRPALKAAW
jgi:hypothetical protein